MTSKRTFQGSVRQLIRQMEQKKDKMTKIASLKPEDKQSSSYAIQSVDDNESSNFFKKSTIPKQTANTVGSLNMASEFSAEFSAEKEATSKGNEEEGYGKDAEIDNGIPVATDRVSIDKIASGNSREVALKAANAEEFKFTISIDDLNEGHWRTFDSTYNEGQNLISKARRPDLLPLRPDSYNRPAFSVTPDEVGNATNTTPDHVVNPFQLPVRFWKRIQTSSGGSDVGPSMSVVDDDVCLEETEEEEETRRGENMEMALAWIQQELRQMKEDDRRLARQLLQLRASVHQLRGLTDCQSFNSDEGDADVDPDWSSNSSRSTRSLDLCPATSSSIDGGGGGGCFASTPAAMDAERHRRVRSGLLGDDDGVRSEVVGSDPQLFTGRRCPRKEVYV